MSLLKFIFNPSTPFIYRLGAWGVAFLCTGGIYYYNFVRDGSYSFDDKDITDWNAQVRGKKNFKKITAQLEREGEFERVHDSGDNNNNQNKS